MSICVCVRVWLYMCASKKIVNETELTNNNNINDSGNNKRLTLFPAEAGKALSKGVSQYRGVQRSRASSYSLIST